MKQVTLWYNFVIKEIDIIITEGDDAPKNIFYIRENEGYLKVNREELKKIHDIRNFKRELLKK